MAAQSLAALAAARRASELAELVGIAALSATDRRYQEFDTAFARRVISQERGENRGLDDTLDRAWQALAVLPRRELTMLSAAALDAHYPAGPPGDGGQR